MSYANSLTPAQLAILSSVVAVALSQNLNADEINILGNFVTAVGATLLIIAAKMASDESQQQSQNQNNGSKNNSHNSQSKSNYF
ncbi:hypothetical protein [Clostridium sp. JNZ J1-5]|nr:hypothetical protein [Clostridium sp.]